MKRRFGKLHGLKNLVLFAEKLYLEQTGNANSAVEFGQISAGLNSTNEKATSARKLSAPQPCRSAAKESESERACTEYESTSTIHLAGSLKTQAEDSSSKQCFAIFLKSMRLGVDLNCNDMV